MAAREKTPRDAEKAKADAIAKQKAKDAAAEKKAAHAAELDKPASPEGDNAQRKEDEINSLAAKGLQDGSSLSDDEVQSLAGSVLSKADDVGTAEKAEDGQGDTVEEDNPQGKLDEAAVHEMVEAVRSELRDGLQSLSDRIDAVERGMRKVGVKGIERSSHVGRTDQLGQIDDLGK